MNEKKILVMTSFGLVPFEFVKEYLPKEALKEVEEASWKNKKHYDPCYVEFYIERLAKKKKWDYRKMESYIKNLESFSVSAAFSVLLREVALFLDSHCEDSINNSEDIFVISITNGAIGKLDKKSIKNYRNFAAFRTYEEAKFAHVVLEDYLNKMFSGHK